MTNRFASAGDTSGGKAHAKSDTDVAETIGSSRPKPQNDNKYADDLRAFYQMYMTVESTRPQRYENARIRSIFLDGYAHQF
jgi:hypothetical protein